MRGLYRKLHPFTPDSAGAAAVFADLAALIMPLDMNGTVSTFRNRVGVLPESGVRVCSALGFRELSYVLGDTEACISECLDFAERFNSAFIVVLHGPVSAMTGIDIRALAAEIESRSGKPAVAVDCSGNGSYEAGVTKALLAVFERVRALEQDSNVQLRPDAAHARTVNLLGLNSVDHNQVQTRRLLVEAVASATHSPIESVWGCFDGWEAWGRARNAQRNVVASASGLRLAKLMEQTWGIPYSYLDDLPLALHGDWQRYAGAGKGVRVLVVHEQVTANVLRNQISVLGCDTAVGGFHSFSKERAREGDVHFDSERSFEEHVAAKRYDVIVCDKGLAPCVPPQTKIVHVNHSAVAPVALRDANARISLSPEWFESLRRELVG